MEAIRLQKEIWILNEKRAKLKKQRDLLKEKLNTIFLDLHKKLIEANFYSEFISGHCGETLEKAYYFNSHDFPYRYCGEGDYRKINFNLIKSGKFITLNEFISYNQSANGVLLEVPLDIIDSQEAINIFVQSIIYTQKENIRLNKQERLKSDIEKKTKELNNLKSKL